MCRPTHATFVCPPLPEGTAITPGPTRARRPPVQAKRGKVQVVLFTHAAKQMLFVAFRGSNSNRQLLGQAIDPCQVRLPGEPRDNSPPRRSHSCSGQPMRGSEYVVTALQQLLPKFKRKVESLLVTSARGYTPVFVGHSLGGALATLASAVLARDGVIDGRRVLLYTFGSPRTGAFRATCCSMPGEQRRVLLCALLGERGSIPALLTAAPLCCAGDGCFVTKFIELISTSFRVTNNADPVCEIPRTTTGRFRTRRVGVRGSTRQS